MIRCEETVRVGEGAGGLEEVLVEEFWLRSRSEGAARCARRRRDHSAQPAARERKHAVS